MGHIGGVTQQISPRHSLSPFGASVRNFQRRRTEQLEEVLGTGLREIKAFLHDLGNIDSKQFRESESPTRNPVNFAECLEAPRALVPAPVVQKPRALATTITC